MTKILFVHPNFPAQFKNIAELLASNGYDVKFLCQTHYGRKIKGVSRLSIKINDPKMSDEEKRNRMTKHNNQDIVATTYKDAFKQLTKTGWIPEHVVSHSGWGCGIYAKEIWPDVKLTSYLEWWFNPKSSFYFYDENNSELNLNQGKSTDFWKRNGSIAFELSVADNIIAPTQWQKDQLPERLKQGTTVIFDGIDFRKFRRRDDCTSVSPLLTYGTRGMEPVRCFPQFIREIPFIVKDFPDIKIEIAGRDEINYGGRKPKGFKSWGEWAKDYLKENKVNENVEWLGYLSIDDYLCWMSKSWCHLYLTHPYVLSWSFLEALTIGCPIVASKVDPVLEFASDSKINLVDHREIGNIAKKVKEVINDPARWERSRYNQIERLERNYCYEQFLNVTGLDLATNR